MKIYYCLLITLALVPLKLRLFILDNGPHVFMVEPFNLRYIRSIHYQADKTIPTQIQYRVDRFGDWVVSGTYPTQDAKYWGSRWHVLDADIDRWKTPPMPPCDKPVCIDVRTIEK